jgi:hypothetical protein
MPDVGCWYNVTLRHVARVVISPILAMIMPWSQQEKVVVWSPVDRCGGHEGDVGDRRSGPEMGIAAGGITAELWLT